MCVCVCVCVYVSFKTHLESRVFYNPRVTYVWLLLDVSEEKGERWGGEGKENDNKESVSKAKRSRSSVSTV